MKKLITFLFIGVSIFLWGCSSSKPENYQTIKLNDLVFPVPSKAILVWNTQKINKFQILYTYKIPALSGFSDSIVIWKYLWEYPKNEKKFFNIVVDKFIRKVAWAKLVDKSSFSIKNAKVYYFVYSIQNDIINWKWNPDYYWLQAYIFDKPNVYVVNFLFADKKKVDYYKKLLKSIKIK